MQDPDGPGYVRCVWQSPTNDFVELLDTYEIRQTFNDVENTVLSGASPEQKKISEVGYLSYEESGSSSNLARTKYFVVVYEYGKVITFKYQWTSSSDSTGSSSSNRPSSSETSVIPAADNHRLAAEISEHSSDGIAEQNNQFKEGEADHPAKLVEFAGYEISNIGNYTTEQITRALESPMSSVLREEKPVD